MKVLNIEAQNFKGFKNINLDLAGKSTVIFGVNGVGKTSFLSILNYLSWNWLNRLNPAQGNDFKSFSSALVRTGSSRMEISAVFDLGGENFVLKKAYTKAKPGKGTVTEANKKLYDEFIEAFLKLYAEKDKEIPVYVNYSTNRSVLDIPLRIREKHAFSKWAALERATENTLDFRTFFEWFRNQEDYESEVIREEKNFNYEDASLKCVRRAVEAMVPEFQELKVKRNPLRMTIKKEKEEICVDQLSDGEKCTLALLGDLARRLALANPHLQDPLTGEGIVLIDEIELHLHPSWQRKILKVLRNTFPNIQFIISTHSPQVLGEVDDSYALFKLETQQNSEMVAVPVSRMDCLDSNTILETFMQTSHIDEAYQKSLDTAYTLIGNNSFEKAENKINEIRAIDAYNPEVIRLEAALKRARYVYEKNK